jgi:hypothetical protein
VATVAWNKKIIQSRGVRQGKDPHAKKRGREIVDASHRVAAAHGLTQISNLDAQLWKNLTR